MAAELERRWNQKLEEVDRVKKVLQEADDQRQLLTAQQEQRVKQMGAGFKQVWESELCPMELKKKTIRTVIEEIVRCALVQTRSAIPQREIKTGSETDGCISCLLICGLSGSSALGRFLSLDRTSPHKC